MKTIVKILFFAFILLQGSPASAAKNELFSLSTEIPEGFFEATVFKGSENKFKAILVITPTIKGITSVEKSLANYFAQNGYLVLVTHPFEVEMSKAFPSVQKIDEEFFKPSRSVESFIKMMENKFALKANIPVVALGGSQGGIFTLGLASQIPRIKASWISVAGGDFPSIYAYSQQEKLIAFRNNHMKILKMTDVNEYERYLRSELKNDPLNICQNMKGTLVQIIALKDTIVPTVNQELIVERCPEHTVIRENIGHASGVLLNLAMRKQILNYFDQAVLNEKE